MARTSKKTVEAPAQEDLDGTFTQPLSKGKAQPAYDDVSNIIGLRQNAYPTREAWLNAANENLAKFFKEHGDNVAANVLVSISKPTAKREKDKTGTISLVGKVAFTYPPRLSQVRNDSDVPCYQIFISAQLTDDEDLMLALAGQLLRTAIWDDEKDKPDGLSKPAKELLTKYGLSQDISSGSVACLRSSILLPHVMATVRDLGPSPYMAIAVDPKDVTPRTANRGARIFCADEKCACHATESAKNKKNKTGGYYQQVSDSWIKEYLALANVSINPDPALEGETLTGEKCSFAKFSKEDYAKPDLCFAWSEYEIEARKKAANPNYVSPYK